MCAEDTDIFILALAFQEEMNAKRFLRCGSVMRTRFIYVNKVAICDALPIMHAFTGCDTVSTFIVRGKLGALKLLMSHSTYQ